MSEITEEQGQYAAELMQRAQLSIGLMAQGFTASDLDLMEQSLAALEDSMRPRQTLAEMFGRSAFDQRDANIRAKLPALRQFIALCREVTTIREKSRLSVYGSDIFGDTEAQP